MFCLGDDIVWLFLRIRLLFNDFDESERRSYRTDFAIGSPRIKSLFIVLFSTLLTLGFIKSLLKNILKCRRCFLRAFPLLARLCFCCCFCSLFIGEASKSLLLFPVLATVQATDEDSHWLISRTSLKLIVRTHLLLTLRATESVCSHGQVTL